MSALGHKRTDGSLAKPEQCPLWSESGQTIATQRMSDVPLATNAPQQKRSLFDHLLGSNERRLANHPAAANWGILSALTGHSAVGTLEMLNERCFSHKKWVAKPY